MTSLARCDMSDHGNIPYGWYSGMTVNERLVAAGLLADFDTAVENRDGESMLDLLLAVRLSRSHADRVVSEVLSDPKRFGY